MPASEIKPPRWLNTLLWGNTVALSWMWGLGLFFSVQFTTQFGLPGLLSFAIPINKAQAVAAQILRQGRASHPYLGVRLQALTPQLAREVNATGNRCRLPERNGVVVVDVAQGSPADQGGLRACDLVVKVDGQEVKSPSDVQVAVDRGRVGVVLPVEVERQGRSESLQVKPGELPR